ncbi:MAG: hypothetical protein JNM63_04415, partial [Spirochaetia bacterium]|nr:hypothetical protein [Spirochaetia bacterium]
MPPLSPTFPPGTVILERRAPDGKALLFQNPKEIITAFSAEEVRQALSKMDLLRSRGLHLAGFFSYECGCELNGLGRLLAEPPPDPLLWFGVYENAERLDLDAIRPDPQSFSFGNFSTDETREAYLDKIRLIRKEIEL